MRPCSCYPVSLRREGAQSWQVHHVLLVSCQVALFCWVHTRCCLGLVLLVRTCPHVASNLSIWEVPHLSVIYQSRATQWLSLQMLWWLVILIVIRGHVHSFLVRTKCKLTSGFSDNAAIHTKPNTHRDKTIGEACICNRLPTFTSSSIDYSWQLIHLRDITI